MRIVQIHYYMWITRKVFTVFSVYILIFCCVTAFYCNIVKVSTSNFNGKTIVIDAGHGGRDGGAIGANGTIEKEINLRYVLNLKDKLVAHGYRVVLTRQDDDGLYSNLAKNKKTSDMNARMEIIKQANPNLVISLHMNSFAGRGASGANTYYKIDDEASEYCANLIQKSLQVECNAQSAKAKKGDYFMLNCSYYTSVLIECGFLSNPEEEKLLNNNDYMNKFNIAISNALLLYFGV